MSNENKTIYEFDINLIKDYFSFMERQGPGSPEVTLKALDFVDKLDSNSKIIDVGCGTGGQTMTLGQNTTGQVTGIDIFPDFINQFNENSRKLNLHPRVKGEVGSMFELPFQEDELDLIWSEGAIYFMGFEEGLKEWRKFLKPGGFVAVTEASWFTNQRPKEINDFWNEAYPGIDTIPNKVAQMQNVGFIPVATFILPEYCWTKNFYELQPAAEKLFLEKYSGDKAAKAFVEYQHYEKDLYYKYKDYYGYVFYLGKKI
jgi:SAM-dependent methyltransferase